MATFSLLEVPLDLAIVGGSDLSSTPQSVVKFCSINETLTKFDPLAVLDSSLNILLGLRVVSKFPFGKFLIALYWVLQYGVHSISALPQPRSKMSRHPEVLWAQRSDKVYLTVALPDAKDINIKCEPEGSFSFSAIGVQGEPFHFTLDLYGPITPDGCKTKVGLRNILCSIQKDQKGWWKRLLKTEEKPAPYIKVDWNKWCDEDEEDTTCEFFF
ncbi:unnamed protein product [Prunus armeniaca]